MEVLITDYAWDDLEIERGILDSIGVSIVAAKTGAEDELVQLAPPVVGILTNWKPVTKNVIANAPRCKVIARYGIGLDNIDVQFATESGIIVTNVPAYCLDEVAEHALALLLGLARKIAFFDRSIKGGEYNLRAGTPLFRIKGKTLGIVGFGKIGRTLYQKAKCFGLQVIVYEKQPITSSEEPIRQVSLDEILQQSDYISVHLPLTPETRHLFNWTSFQKMKRTALLINTSRGDIVDTRALRRALDEGLIAGAGLDVLPEEPPDPRDPLVLHPKTIITPHAAFNSVESVEELRRATASEVAAVLSGKLPKSIVNADVFHKASVRANLAVASPKRA